MTAAAVAEVPFAVLRRQISDRVTVMVRPDPTLGFVVLDMWHCAGSIHDPAGLSGLAHVVEHVVHSAGGDADSRYRGDSANATTTFERTNYVDTGPPGALPELLAHAVDRLRPEGLGTGDRTGRTLDAHRRVVLEEIRQREEPARFGSGPRRSLRLLFGADHPYGKPPLGRPEEVSAITAADVEEFLDHCYGNARLVVSVVGSVDSGHALDLAERALAGLPSPSRPSLPGEDASSAPPAAPGGRRREDVQEGQPTGVLRYTFALPSQHTPLAAAGEVTMALLAGAPWSVLGADLVARHHVLGASAQHVPNGAGPSLGLLKLSVPAGTDVDLLDRAVTERLDRLAHTGPEEDVLTAAKARRAKDYLGVLSRARACAEELCRGESARSPGTAGTPEDAGPRPTGRLADLRRVSAQQTALIAGRHLVDPAVVVFHAEHLRSTAWIV
ncbi:MAG: zinc protease [Streptomyces sp.]|nr:zinc protease [Streptomyces sp.]